MSNNIKFDIVNEEEKPINNNTNNNTNSKNDNKGYTVPLASILNDYLSKNKPVVYILTPCYGGSCYINYVHCLLRTFETFKKYNIELYIEFCRNDSLVTRARNNLVARAMNNPNMTHIMFIDSDITWDPNDLLLLLMSNKNIVGGVYPLKRYNWDKLLTDRDEPIKKSPNMVQKWINQKNNSHFKDAISDEEAVQFNMVDYNINYIDSVLNIEKNLAKVRHLATGFMMIKRNVIEKMSAAFPSTKYTDDVNFLRPEENKFAYALFDCGVEDDHYLSEDWLFCHRWSKMGGTIWINVTISLTHTGPQDFRGCYISSIM